jgi:hypothetical protein
MVVKVPDEDDRVKHLTDSSAQTFWTSLFIGVTSWPARPAWLAVDRALRDWRDE